MCFCALCYTAIVRQLLDFVLDRRVLDGLNLENVSYANYVKY